MYKEIRKRNGTIVPFDENKITEALLKAFKASNEIGLSDAFFDTEKKKDDFLLEICQGLSDSVIYVADKKMQKSIEEIPTVEFIQDVIENVLMSNFQETARRYIRYRAEREKVRNVHGRLDKSLNEILNYSAKDSDIKRENANVDADTAMGSMLKAGSESTKQYYLNYMLNPIFSKAHLSGDIHIHDLDFYSLTLTCCQIDLTRLFRNGFSTGHGFLREPASIQSYAALAAIAIQANQNDMHGGQSIPSFDRDMAEGVKKTYRKEFRKAFTNVVEQYFEVSGQEEIIKQCLLDVEKEYNLVPTLNLDRDFDQKFLERLSVNTGSSAREVLRKSLERAKRLAYKETNRATFQAMESFVHNLNTMHSRAGAQTPFSSINYGTDTTPEGRLVIENLLLTTMDGLGNGETPIFPIQIFKLKKGINAEPGDPNYDLFELACKVSCKRMFPNFSFLDAPFNAQYYQEGNPDTEIAYMGCRTRVIGNTYAPDKEVAGGRGNCSFTSINLPRLAFRSKGEISRFYELLLEQLELVKNQLLERFEVQAQKKVKNFPFLMGQGVWLDSERLSLDEEIREVIKHGTLSIGFIGLAETLTLLSGEHHAESKESQKLGLEIISYMRNFCDASSKQLGLNFSLLATPAEGLSGRFIRLDQKEFGIIKGVTDKEYYTNSFHVPVSYQISAAEKIRIEAPYHALTNAGHITYIELDGDPGKNIEAFKSIVHFMMESGIGYGALNHPIDRDPVCGYCGLIDNECPKCGRSEEDGPSFERIRRITGYLVGTVDRFNDAKRAEEKARVKHSTEPTLEKL
jgi:ribonucleoside-triphosphate reductase